jgi:hypothetical protein
MADSMAPLSSFSSAASSSNRWNRQDGPEPESEPETAPTITEATQGSDSEEIGPEGPLLTIWHCGFWHSVQAHHVEVLFLTFTSHEWREYEEYYQNARSGNFWSLRDQPEFWFCDQPEFGFVTNRNLGHL